MLVVPHNHVGVGVSWAETRPPGSLQSRLRVGVWALGDLELLALLADVLRASWRDQSWPQLLSGPEPLTPAGAVPAPSPRPGDVQTWDSAWDNNLEHLQHHHWQWVYEAGINTLRGRL